jgi:UrcA family protein
MEHDMNQFNTTYRTLSMALAFAGLFTATSLAVAQNVTEEIIVRAPAERVIDVSPVGSPVKVKDIEINRYVSITDLDLSSSEDVNELDKRIDAVAKESCQKLFEMFPLNPPNATEMNGCIKKAVASARKQTELAISVGH